jgi:hypothetical protein
LESKQRVIRPKNKNNYFLGNLNPASLENPLTRSFYQLLIIFRILKIEQIYLFVTVARAGERTRDLLDFVYFLIPSPMEQIYCFWLLGDISIF